MGSSSEFAAKFPGITILHLSDLQFGRAHRFGNDQGTLLERVSADVARMKASEDALAVDLVVLSGDLAEWGLATEFAQVRDFAEGLAKILRLERRRVVLLPGNHDVNRKLAEAYFAACEGNEQKPKRPFWPKLEPFAAMFRAFYAGSSEPAFTEEQPWTLYEYPELRVLVAALNSTIADSHKAEHHLGFAGEEQLRWFAERVKPRKDDGWICVGAIHHDPVHHETVGNKAGDEEAIRDREDLARILAPHLDFILSGHTHAQRIQPVGVPPSYVLAAGSAGVQAAERPSELQNQYQILRARGGVLEVLARRYLPDRREWVGDTGVDPRGADWHRRLDLHVRSGRETASPEPTLQGHLERYRAFVQREFRHLGLFRVVAPEQEEAPLLTLESIFVEPKVRELYLDPQGTSGPTTPLRSVLRGADIWHYVVGGPGTGKSLLTRWLALTLCSADNNLGVPVDVIPVHIELRRYADAKRRAAVPEGFTFFDYLDIHLRAANLDLAGEDIRALAKRGRVFWLFDGLDEVSDPGERQALAQRIADQRAAFQCRGLVTSRAVSVDATRKALEGPGLRTFEVLPFDPAQTDEFLERWHGAVFAAEPETGANRLAHIRRVLQENASLRELATRPMLLTLLAALNQRGAVPKERVAVYDDAIDLLVDRWETAKGPSRSRWSKADKLGFLRRLAWAMMTELPGGAGNLVEKADLVRQIREWRGDTGLPPQVEREAEGLVSELRERDGILVSLGEDAYGFAHRGLLEYLAASEIFLRFREDRTKREVLCGPFREHWRESEWEETLLLLCELVAKDDAALIVPMVQAMMAVVPLSNANLLARVHSIGLRSVAAALSSGSVEDLDAFRLLALAVVESVEGHGDYWGWGFWPSGVSPFRALQECRIRAGKRSGDVDQLWDELAEREPNPEVPWRDAVKPFVAALVPHAAIAEELVALRAWGEGPWTEAFLDRPDVLGDGELVGKLVVLAERRGDRAGDRCLILLTERGSLTAAEAVRRRWDAPADNRESFLGALIAIPSYRRFAVERSLVIAAEYEGDALPGVAGVALQALEQDPSLGDLGAILSSGRSWYVRRVAALGAWREEPDWDGFAGTRAAGGATLLDVTRLGQLHDRYPQARRLIVELTVGTFAIADGSARLALAQWLAGRDPVRASEQLVRCFSDGDPLTRGRAAAFAHAAGLLKEESTQVLRNLVTFPGAARWGLPPQPQIFRRAAFWSHGVGAVVVADAMVSADDPEVRHEAADRLLEGQAAERRRGLRYWSGIIANSDDVELVSRAAWNVCAYRDLRPDEEVSLRRALCRSPHVPGALLVRDREMLRRSPAKGYLNSTSTALALLDAHLAFLRLGRLRRARVRFGPADAGLLEETPGGTRFTYSAAYLATPGARPLAPTLPLRVEPYESRGLHSFFQNLLPEGWLYEVTVTQLGIESTDALGVLLATGSDLVGAVEVIEQDPLEQPS
jgi:HipA-like protein